LDPKWITFFLAYGGSVFFQRVDHIFLDDRILSKDNRPISTRGIQKRFEHICKKAGLLRPGLSIHKLRHTCLSLLLQEGVDLPTLQLLAGHEEIGTTAIYLHVSPQQAESAVEMHPLNAR